MNRLSNSGATVTKNQTFNNVFNMYNSDKSNEEIAQNVLRKMEEKGSRGSSSKLAALYDGGDS